MQHLRFNSIVNCRSQLVNLITFISAIQKDLPLINPEITAAQVGFLHSCKQQMLLRII